VKGIEKPFTSETIDQEPESVQIDQILAVKRRGARLSVTFEDQRYCVTALQTVESEVFDITDLREYFRDSLAHLEYALRSVGRQQARLAELHQHYLLTLQEKTNRRLRLLTIISAIFMPRNKPLKGGKLCLISLGLAVMTRDKIEELAKELTEKGKISEKEGKELIDDLLKKSEQARKDLETKVEDMVRSALEKIDVATKEDIARLEEKIRHLEQKQAPENKTG